jgi:DNA-binding beta-propeller fold protein YncE
VCACLGAAQPLFAQTQPSSISRVATGLQNPRGIAVLPDGRLLVAEAGTGFIPDDPADYTGRLNVFADENGDGDYDDAGERTPVIDHLPGYNILYQFNPGRDEVLGIGDVLALDDGRAFFTLDDNFDKISIVALDASLRPLGDLMVRDGSMNSIAYDPHSGRMYVAESSFDAVSAVSLDGKIETIARFGLLAHSQQAVPAGVAVDPRTGDVLVALFSGQLWDYYGSILSYMPGDAKIVRVNPTTGAISDVITGLTTAVDVDVDDAGNIFVVELTTRWATPLLTDAFDLYDPNAPPDAGGYPRFSGRVTQYSTQGGTPLILAADLDAPTNVTYHAGMLYVSTGQGTPGRSIWGRDGATCIDGEIYEISVAACDSCD